MKKWIYVLFVVLAFAVSSGFAQGAKTYPGFSFAGKDYSFAGSKSVDDVWVNAYDTYGPFITFTFNPSMNIDTYVKRQISRLEDEKREYLVMGSKTNVILAYLNSSSYVIIERYTAGVEVSLDLVQLKEFNEAEILPYANELKKLSIPAPIKEEVSVADAFNARRAQK